MTEIAPRMEGEAHWGVLRSIHAERAEAYSADELAVIAGHADELPVFMAFRVTNFSHLRAAWGAGRARRMCRELVTMLADVVGSGGVVRFDGADGARLVLPWQSALEADVPAGNFVRAFCDLVALRPVTVDDTAAHLAVEGAWHRAAPGASAAAWLEGSAASPGIASPGHAGDAPAREDMAEAVRLFGLLRQNRITLAWQPIRRLAPDGGAGDILYHAARLCGGLAADASGPSFSIEVMERLGLARTFDRFIVERVVRRLRDTSDDTVLGVAISGHSAALGDWWDDLTVELNSAPQIARRLVIQITQTAPLPSVPKTTDFVATLRRLGCRVAIADFGAGPASPSELLAVAPDLVKLDAGFLHRAAALSDDGLLRHALGLARAIAPIVVADCARAAATDPLAPEPGARSIASPGRSRGDGGALSGSFPQASRPAPPRASGATDATTASPNPDRENGYPYGLFGSLPFTVPASLMLWATAIFAAGAIR